METRSDANKALYYKIQHDILKKEQDEGHSNSQEALIRQKATEITEMQEKMTNLHGQTDKINKAMDKTQYDHDRKQLFSGKVH